MTSFRKEPVGAPIKRDLQKSVEYADRKIIITEKITHGIRSVLSK